MGIRSEGENVWSMGIWKVRVDNGSWSRWDHMGRDNEQARWVCEVEGCAKTRNVRTQRTNCSS